MSKRTEIYKRLIEREEYLINEISSLRSQLSKMEEENKRMKQTILTAHYWLGNYTNDADNATHAKRILHNAIHEFNEALAGKGEASASTTKSD